MKKTAGLYKSRTLCLNCGKRGHVTKTCHYPTNSYGCVIYKLSNDDKIRYLMIQRKYTPEYLELLRGHYYVDIDILDYQYLKSLVSEVTLIERNYIMKHEFDYLWRNIWKWNGTEEQMSPVQNNYKECEQRFNLLKNGHIFDHYGYMSFQELFNNNPCINIEPDWEFPKGKRIEGESDQQCAIRESCEETSFEPSDFNIYLHVKPFQDKFTGVNSVKYCNSYYLAKLLNIDRTTYYDPSHMAQNNEIRKIGWFTESEIYQLINPRNVARLKMINNINSLVLTLDK